MPVRTHVVQPGEFLIRIAAEHGTTLAAILAANPQITNPGLIHVGDVITLPDMGAAPAATGAPGQVVVQPGDTLSGIAARVGVTLDQLLAANPSVTDPDLIIVGQIITIPSGDKVRVVGPTPPAAPPSGTPVAGEPVAGDTPAMDWTQESIAVRMRHVMALLVDTYGYADVAAAGIVGNLKAESAVIPNRLEGSASATPMRGKRASDPGGPDVDFTAQEIMDLDPASGPARHGIGLAQWTARGRRSALFAHEFAGRALREAIVFDMDAQVDFIATELRTTHARVDEVLRSPGVTLEQASDKVTLDYETPGGVLTADFRPLPSSDLGLQRVLADRRRDAQAALTAFRAP